MNLTFYGELITFMKWTHPTQKQPKIVTLVCLGPTHQNYVQGIFQKDLSDALLGADEIWTLNRGGPVFRHDLLWVMDNIQGEADQWPAYGATLWKHDKPIITSDNAEGWPDHVYLYPWDEIQTWLTETVKPAHDGWFHNSVPYILVYAAFIGVTELRVYGGDFASHNNGTVESGHPNVAYWVGCLERTGLIVRPYANSQFLNASQRDYIYGYRYDPRKIKQSRAKFRALIEKKCD